MCVCVHVSKFPINLCDFFCVCSHKHAYCTHECGVLYVFVCVYLSAGAVTVYVPVTVHHFAVVGLCPCKP